MPKKPLVAVPLPCPCASGTSYQACCEQMHLGAPAASALALMRSRYSAFVYQLDAYLLATWHPSTRPAQLQFEERLIWLGLEIYQHDATTVEFVTRSKIGGNPAVRHRERSRFVLEAGRWLYVDGVLQ